MKQIQAFGPQDLRLVDVAEPQAGEGEVIVDVKACGICGSDKWCWHVTEHSDYVAGHEVAGIVAQAGPGVVRLQPGDRVAVNNVKGCGVCKACKEGAYVRCARPITHMGFGFSEKIAVPERNCLPLEPEIGYEAGSLIFDNWGTPYAALSRTSIGEGDRVAVTGCGPIGLAAAALAVLRGAKVAAVDPIEERRAAAIRMGAEIALKPGEDTEERLRTWSGGEGVGYVVECSGKAASYELAFGALRIGGTIVVIGEGARFEFQSSRLIGKHIQITASLYAGMKDGEAVQRLMAQGAIDPMAIVTHRFAMEEVPGVFGQVVEGAGGLLKTIVVQD
ncbi:alcohol dehydrogenase catalytic domain-containing protein [Paenibacillus lycopersici]|uniref:Alcohol dehydrogenase catalytic domain-containing protein n=1 Tax=Paenibacillus lycopersici TaxID=2704462 RepID=A0A6C0G3W1_9BACL|nr:zinc-binding dehydrogenase [Paenibacillus lycopersici]QHT61400.1 alcohol dehydrogenase catalytic domain-containing protein [Paenibacillus lycopersici]